MSEVVTQLSAILRVLVFVEMRFVLEIVRLVEPVLIVPVLVPICLRTVLLILVGIRFNLFESLLDLLVAVLILLRLHCQLHNFWVDWITWLPKLVVLVCKVTLVAQSADFVRLVMAAPLGFILFIDFVKI